MVCCRTYIIFGGGYILNNILLDYHGKGNSTTWLPYGEFVSNVGDILEGFLGLLYVLPPHDSMAVMSGEGIKYLPNMIIFLGLLSAVIIDLYVVIKNKLYVEKQILLIECILWGNLTTFSVLNLTYGSPVYELRYLIPCFWMMILMIAYHFSRIEWKKKRAYLALRTLFVTSVGLSLFLGYQEYITEKNIISDDKKIANQIAETEADLVFFMEEGLNLPGCNVRCLDLDRTYHLINEKGYRVQNGGLQIYDDYAGEPISCTFVCAEKREDIIETLKVNDWNYLEIVEGYAVLSKECTRIYYEEGFLRVS